MPVPSTPSRRRRWFARPLPLSVLAGVLLGLWCARGPLLGPLVARVAASALAGAVGGEASIGQAGGGWLHDAAVARLRLAGTGWRVEADEAAATYGLGLLGGDPGALRSLRVAGLQVTVADGPAATTPAAWPAILARLPAVLPALDVEGGLTLDGLVIEGLHLQGASDRLELSARRIVVAGRETALPVCVLRRTAPDSLSLESPVLIGLPGLAQALQCERLELTLGDAVQRLTASGRIAGGSWTLAAASGSLRLEAHGVDLAALGLLPATLGAVPVDAVVEQAGAGWALRSLRLAAAGVELRVRGEIQPAPWRCLGLDAEVVADLAELRRLLPDLPEAEGRVTASLRGSVPLDPERWLQGDLVLDVAGSGLVWGGTACPPQHLAVHAQGGVLRLTGLEAGWGGLQAVLDGPEAAGADTPSAGWRLQPRPIRIAGGTLLIEAGGGSAGDLAGSLRLDGVPLASLPGLSALRHVRGTASGRIDLGGTLRQPLWSGSLTVEGVEAKFTADVPTLTAGKARVRVAPGLLTIDSLEGDLGGAVLAITGTIRPAGGDQAIDLRCTGSNLLLVQRPDARVRADLDLRLSGPLAAPLLSGEVLVVNALITPELQLIGGSHDPAPVDDGRFLLFELPDPPLSTLRFDLQVRTPPARAGDAEGGVRVATRWGRGRCDLDLRLGGTGAAPAPLGRVVVRDGVATLPFSTLKVTHGELVFPAGEPFRPRLAATAGARIRQYDVQVQVSGPLDQPVLRVSGSGLDEQEATTLLTTGSTPRELQGEEGQKAALGRVGTWLGQETWRTIEGPEDPDEGASLIDRVTVEWGREISAQGRDTIDSEVELTTPGSAPSVLLYGERDRYDQYNAGIILRVYWGGEEP